MEKVIRNKKKDSEKIRFKFRNNIKNIGHPLSDIRHKT